MKQFTYQLLVATQGRGLYEITSQVAGWVERCGITTGLLTLFIQHTSASLTVQENADPDVTRDLEEFFRRLAPENASWYRHTLEGPDDMPAHIRAALTQTQLSVPIASGRPVLGTWQGLFVFEHRAARQSRRVLLHCLGD